MVLQQNIPSGTVVQEKTVMELVVSAGYEKGYMPDIVGLSKDEVMKLLLDMGRHIRELEAEAKDRMRLSLVVGSVAGVLLIIILI